MNIPDDLSSTSSGESNSVTNTPSGFTYPIASRLENKGIRSVICMVQRFIEKTLKEIYNWYS